MTNAHRVYANPYVKWKKTTPKDSGIHEGWYRGVFFRAYIKLTRAPGKPTGWSVALKIGDEDDAPMIDFEGQRGGIMRAISNIKTAIEQFGGTA